MRRAVSSWSSGTLKVCVALLLPLFAGCGNDDTKKEATPAAAASPTRDRSKVTRTENTPLAGEAGCYKAPDKVPDDICAMALKVFELTNEKRALEGKPPLKHHAGWHYAATFWSKGQADAGKISHDGFPEARWDAYEAEFGNDGMPELAAENVGVVKHPGKSNDEIATSLADGWYQSPGHHKNMMGDFEYLGIGIYKTEDGKFYATQLFAWEP